MPKMKSKSGARKRFRLTGSKQIKRFHAFSSHILTSKTRKRKRNLRKSALVDPTDMRKVKKLIVA
ncbi:MAG: 50S ribosomal protein L35 [candidate division KSB1 bacterium]|nr:50S ribosomal protein L35 [candidate division KSB1 bacterium]MDZ7341110.1 50S ribosomal protein L35 [candidate division KSB1 bacterium]